MTTVTSVSKQTHVHRSAQQAERFGLLGYVQQSTNGQPFKDGGAFNRGLIISAACSNIFSELLWFPLLGYSVAVGEFTGDSEQGEKARSSLQLTAFSSRGNPH